MGNPSPSDLESMSEEISRIVQDHISDKLSSVSFHILAIAASIKQTLKLSLAERLEIMSKPRIEEGDLPVLEQHLRSFMVSSADLY